MAFTITRAQHKQNFATGKTPSGSQFAALIDAFPMIYTATVTLVADTDLSVEHGNAENARVVQVLDSNGQQVEVTWRRDPLDPTNKVILNSAKAYARAEVSILTKA